MNIQRKLQQELYIEHNPIGIVADASCSWPFDFNAQPILSQSANYLGHDISDERNKDALELFYLSSDRNHWPESSMSDYERGSVERAINAQLESKAAVLFLAADPRLIPKSSSLKDCLADVLSNKASQTTRQSLMVSQVMDCHSAFAGQAAVQQALTQSLPAILEQTLQETASKPELQKALSAMQLIKTQVNYLNSKLFSWFVFQL